MTGAKGVAIASEVLVILLLVLLNGVLAGAEIAIVGVRRTRLSELVEQGHGGARAVQRLRDKPERFLATVQIGITVVGATAGAFGGATFAKDLEPLLALIAPVAPYAEQLALGLVVALVSYLSLVLGELVPKSLALKAAEPYALFIARPLEWLSVATRPLVWFLTASSNLVLKVFRDSTTFTETRLSPEELRQMVEEAARAGTVDAHAGKIASRALDFADLVAADVMVPRGRVVALPRSASREEVRQLLLEKSHSRVPVYDESIDNIVGYISMKDVLAFAWEEQLFVLEDLVRPAFFVPETKKAVELLTELQERHLALAMVVDEQGGTAGLVTLEDLLEELVGEIFSEHARSGPAPYKAQPDGSYVVLGAAALREINRELRFELPEEGEWVTVAGLCLALARRIPDAGDVFHTANGYTLEIVDASARRIRAVRVRPPVPAAPRGA